MTTFDAEITLKAQGIQQGFDLNLYQKRYRDAREKTKERVVALVSEIESLSFDNLSLLDKNVGSQVQMHPRSVLT
jgi:hypothetical protein